MATRQQFIFTNKTVQITTILFKNLSSILDVEKIVFFKETSLKGNWLKKEFRYSFDDITWSSWRTLTQQALQNLDFTNHPNFFLEILYTRKNYNSANIEDFYLFYDSNTGTPVDPSTALIDADTLQGENGAYYLDPSNFVGSYPGIKVFNVEDSSEAGVYSHRIDTSTGSEFYFKRIEGSPGLEVIDGSDGIITLEFDGSIAGGASYENPLPVDETVGGITDGDTFFAGGKTFAETMEAIFYPLAVPILTNPSSTFIENAAYLQTIGDSISIQFTSTMNRGSINPQYTATSPYRSGPGNTVHYTGTGLPSSVGSTPSSPNIQTVNPYVVLLGINSWTNYWDYDAGVQPYDSKGNPYSSPLSAGNTSTDSVSLEGVYPLYATTDNIANATIQPLVSMITGDHIEMQMVAEPPFGSDRQKFEIPDVWLASRPLVSIQFFSSLDPGDPWKYEGGSAASSLTYWTPTPTSHVINGPVNYTRYSYNPFDKQGTVLYRLNFS